jgi:hypothetical protein
VDRPVLQSLRWVAWEETYETYEITWLHDGGGRGLRGACEHERHQAVYPYHRDVIAGRTVADELLYS